MNDGAQRAAGARTTQEEHAVIALTDKAATKVSELITAEGEDNLALRVAVRPGGCSGFSYDMFFDTEIADDDLTSEFGGVKVVVDPTSAMMLDGATLDYADGLNQAGFSINNPNAQRTCGCGSSFS
jgi:iron-sulfur cluster assembly protein/iron-sulfur cluster insertion protein